ncbi:MAG: fumarylacetoacetate hydrolase family protein [Planctomycetota bacterium]|jgi:2-keto-4-pentenoate hydratase/2-oxohepta-3-ene-1,7-dioic acid hydratase in catechol pathway
MRIIRFVANDGRVLCGEDQQDGTALVVEDEGGVLVASPASDRISQLRGMRVLVADDDQNMRLMLSTVLDKAGCSVIGCADGAEAMRAIEAEAVDLVVSDIMMPHHNGYEIFSAAKTRDALLPVLLVTGFGYDPSHSLMRASQEGLQGVLYKPFTPRELIEQLLRIIESTRGAPSRQLRRTEERAHISTLLTPVRPRNIICVGRNYRDPEGKAVETPPVDQLELFMKPTTSLLADHEPIRIPSFDQDDARVECEGELAVVIGRRAEEVSSSEALDYVLGYTIANDVTARRWQTSDGGPRWMRGKGFDTFCPLGPALVSGDEVGEPRRLTITTSVNGRAVRQGSSDEMILPVAEIISEVSRRITLESGTLLLTGSPPRLSDTEDVCFVRPGDEITVEISEIGTLVNPVVSA